MCVLTIWTSRLALCDGCCCLCVCPSRLGSPNAGDGHVPLPKLRSGGRIQVLNVLCGLVPNGMVWIHTSFQHVTTWEEPAPALGANADGAVRGC